MVIEIDHIAEIDRRLFDLLALAELPVGDEQVAEIDAAERLDFAGHGLRIVHGGGDEVIEVDVLDVERLAHVRAAGLQQATDLPLVGDPVKLRLDGIRPGRDLAERQRRSENLDEERFHLASRMLGSSDVP